MLIVDNRIQSNYAKQHEAAASNYRSNSNTIKTRIAIERSVYMQWLAINRRRALALLTSFCAPSKAQTEAEDDVRPIFTQVKMGSLGSFWVLFSFSF